MIEIQGSWYESKYANHCAISPKTASLAKRILIYVEILATCLSSEFMVACERQKELSVKPRLKLDQVNDPDHTRAIQKRKTIPKVDPLKTLMMSSLETIADVIHTSTEIFQVFD